VNELERIVREVVARKPYLLATVVRVEGSSYRRPGARMLVAGERWISGCVSGGCLEGDVLMKGAFHIRDGPAVITYDSSRDEGDPWGVGLGCGGVVDLLLERVDGPTHDVLAFAAACFERETTGVLATVIRSDRTDVRVGSRVGVGPYVTMQRPVAACEVTHALVAACSGPPGVVEVSGVTALVEVIAPSPQLFVLGSGHDAGPLVSFARSLGFRVTVADASIHERSRFVGADRVIATNGEMEPVRELIDAAHDPFVVIMHHAHAADAAAIGMALASRARYVGVLGPARRTRELLAPGRASDPRLHAPVGLDIGAETPEQIALAIAAELQTVAHAGRGGRLRDRARSIHG
jgi:xanthine/CO dehydrogenase XdhC/CoxF family maturation factor